ncbi:EIN3-binding F-box protein 1-like isoform X2 [Olea europaea var. sylvestris]|uniref:EIN3-binding F-box protein 1-like isoform X2 n=1 Tax=Olea europaea var. sylvestris TaxID=158386 RepID=UPI000C1CE8FF|nr:EIN3-binding F-box protein 1-like isoform X2 [Olea europaea var. sylvestris]
MPALVNYSGDDNFYSGGPFCSGDSGILLSIGSHVDIYCPARKRARISGPLVVEGSVFEDKRPSIDRLPDECLFEIFRHLPGGRERSASACVSKRWLTILSGVRSSEFYRSKVPQGQSDGMNVDLASNNTESISQDEDLAVECDGYLTRCVEGKKATDVRLAAIAVCTSRRGGLGKLSIRGSNSDRGVTDLGLSAIARGCPSLRFLSLWNVPSIGDEGLFEIARECHSLEKLDLCQCPSISNKSIVAIAKSCPNLTALTVESCLNIGNESLQAVGKCCPKLQSITIKDCPLVRDQGVASLLSSASSLMKVKLQTLNISDCSLAVIGHYGKSITSLVLSGLQNVSQKGFWVMGNARGLQTLASLAITSCRGVTDLSLEAIGKGCPNLKQMCIRKCFFVSDNGLVAFAKAVGSLESLQLEECNRITQTGILNAISNCNSKLKSLTLVKCMGIKDLSPESLMLSPSESLRSLAIRSCLGFGSTSLAMLGKLCPQLHHLDLSGLCGITDTGLLPLLESCEAGLTKVNLSHCVNLTDEVVFALARLHGGALELLNLDGCHKVTDASLEPNLQILSLSGCSMISNKSITALKKLGRTLVGLNLQHCNSIGSHTIELLTENLWRCDILS